MTAAAVEVELLRLPRPAQVRVLLPGEGAVPRRTCPRTSRLDVPGWRSLARHRAGVSRGPVQDGATRGPLGGACPSSTPIRSSATSWRRPEGTFDEKAFLKACLDRARMYRIEGRLISGRERQPGHVQIGAGPRRQSGPHPVRAVTSEPGGVHSPPKCARQGNWPRPACSRAIRSCLRPPPRPCLLDQLAGCLVGRRGGPDGRTAGRPVPRAGPPCRGATGFGAGRPVVAAKLAPGPFRVWDDPIRQVSATGSAGSGTGAEATGSISRLHGSCPATAGRDRPRRIRTPGMALPNAPAKKPSLIPTSESTPIPANTMKQPEVADGGEKPARDSRQD